MRRSKRGHGAFNVCRMALSVYPQLRDRSDMVTPRIRMSALICSGCRGV